MHMSTSLVLTVIGPDRPGLVETLSQTLSDYGASWQESRMSRLAGKFAGILRVSVPSADANNLEDALRAHHAEGLNVVIERGADGVDPRFRRTVSLELLGADRPGIVRMVTEALTSKGVNVDELETACLRAPMCGDTLFKLSACLGLPEEIHVDQLRHALEALTDELMVDLVPAKEREQQKEASQVLLD